MKLLHAKNKISEMTSLPSFTSVLTFGKLKIKLIGEYGVNNEFLVRQIFITSDNFNGFRLASLEENMLNHFDMTSNIFVDYMSNSLLHNCLSKHAAAFNLDIANSYPHIWDGLVMSITNQMICAK